MDGAPRLQSLNKVAAAARVSPMTVSRVFRNSPHVSKETRDKVLRAAKKIGYQPDPLISRLMAIVRGTKQRTLRSMIGVVRDDILEDDLHDPAYQYVSTDDIRQRAQRHGYLVEEFFLGRGGLTPSRLNSILRARNVEGLIVSPQSSREIGAQLDYSLFAAATFGYGLQTPALHRASTNMTQGILCATAELGRRGYRRIGIAITQWIDARADHTYSGAFLHYQQRIPARNRVPLLFFPENNPAHGAEAFCAWMKKYQPEAIISFHTYVPEWLTERMQMRIPDDVGLVVHDWNERMQGFAGIHHRRSYVAAAAVDLVATQPCRMSAGSPRFRNRS